MNNDHSRDDGELWPCGDPIEPTDEHALGALNAMKRASIIARKRALANVGYVWIHRNGKAERVSDPEILFPDGMDEEALRPRSATGEDEGGAHGDEAEHLDDDRPRPYDVWWSYRGNPIEPTDEHALGALNAMHRAAIIARKRALARDGYVWMEWNGKSQRVSDPDIIFPDGMDEDALRPRKVIGERS